MCHANGAARLHSTGISQPTGAEPGMPVHNADIAAIFEQIAELLELQGANPFRVRAYRNAARTVTIGTTPLSTATR